MANCTCTVTINGTVASVSAEAGGGMDSDGDIVGLGNVKGSVFGLNAAIVGRLDGGDGISGALRTNIVSWKFGMGLVGGHAVSAAYDTNGQVTFSQRNIVGLGAGLDVNGTGFYGALQFNERCGITAEELAGIFSVSKGARQPIGEQPRTHEQDFNTPRDNDVNPNTGNVENTVSVRDPNTGVVTPVTTVVLHQSATNSGLKGNVYAAGNVGVGQELNGLDQIAHENHIRESISSATPPAPSSNSGNERRSSDGGNKDDGGGTKTGGNGTSKNHSVPSDTGYATKGVNNLEGLEAAGTGPISLYHRHGSGPDCRSWNT